MEPNPPAADPASPCARCGVPLEPGWRFCEGCGADRLARADGAARVRTSESADDLDLGVVAAVTDRGLRRPRNEDAVAIGVLGDVAAAVVCDGVASAPGSARAATDAAVAGLHGLLAALDRGDDAVAATTAGALAAAAAATAVSAPDPGNPPCCTYVSAVVTRDATVVGWVGDSPAYLVDPTGARRLTVDDSAAGRLAADGAEPDDPRLADPAAHALERWLGADSGPVEPRVRVDPAAPGLLLVCSDGLSHYLDAGVVAPADHRAAPAAAARALLGRALAAGGHDNVTVAAIAVAQG
ncbi:protein phosphatase 2C domain-containing protein [Actinokineospora auranticolor]|uniref:Serine/threonine protein phosphatase PrpC n=1 Tax=Actinokineospora auranticolor TaxID=155976 RepID=A0A2S6GMC8_9PSEU|nr:protein phosphatase 2C domain-containing protein [Actinokineospora auranticolor]PPK66388.1 serine/threonine protein phosphatase PrpC [Actinokineospora auranticolor]